MLSAVLKIVSAFLGSSLESTFTASLVDDTSDSATSSAPVSSDRQVQHRRNGGGAEPDFTNEYDLVVSLDPGTGALTTSGTMTIVADQPTSRIDLLLNNKLRVDELRCKPACRFKVAHKTKLDSIVLASTQQLRLTPETALDTGEEMRVWFSYSGVLATENIEFGRGIVSTGWTELSIGALWYPVWLDEPMVRSRLTVRLPDGYNFNAPGQISRSGNGDWEAIVTTPGISRVTFAASNNWVMRERQIDPKRKAILYTAAPTERSEDILNAVAEAYAWYRSALGEPTAIATDLRILYANELTSLRYPREAYATGGSFIVLDESSPEVQRDTIHHEVAHLWFSAGRPGSPDEFLSESLAEYLAMREGGRVWGQDWLTRDRRSTALRSARVEGSLLAIEGFSPTRQSLLYNRGPTALWLLHDRIGADAMDRLLAEAYSSGVTTIEAFFDLLTSRHGAETTAWFKALL